MPDGCDWVTVLQLRRVVRRQGVQLDVQRDRLDELESQVRDLIEAAGDLQHRLSRVDHEDLQWPADLPAREDIRGNP